MISNLRFYFCIFISLFFTKNNYAFNTEVTIGSNDDTINEGINQDTKGRLIREVNTCMNKEEKLLKCQWPPSNSQK